MKETPDNAVATHDEALETIAQETPVWTPEEAEEHYHVKGWGDGYFFVRETGEVAVRPERSGPASISIYEVVRHLKEEKVPFPVLIRFQDVLRGRVQQLNHAFRDAIAELGYRNRYTAVYPIKVNQLHEVVEEVLEAGKPFGMGLECGSKAELVAALAHLEDDDTLLICNGYKDGVMLQLILSGQQLGKNIIPVLEKYDEFEHFMHLARTRKIRPRFGVRVRLTTSGAGRWADSGGDLSKFGISIPELLTLLEHLDDQNRLDAFTLLHFHLGSQIANIQTLKKAVKEIAQIYAQLRQRGVPIRYLDVGGGLGVNYEADFAGLNDGINYTLQEYANAVVHSIMEVCDAEQVEHPAIISESGRAITAHHSVLVVEALGAYRKNEIDPDFTPAKTDHALVHELHATWQWVRETPTMRPAELLEAYHDAAEKRQQADSLFSFGYLPIEQKALAERLYWSICRTINERVRKMDADWLPNELLALDEHLVDQYLCDFSVFQSILDHWAIGQALPHHAAAPPR
ncbi:MAG: biosynthetic arginine decarboxylase [Rhodothermaceae bacterium]|nr:MAG: biosynthetic arginine decarboxylase [Rhodothermaceae bacterium]